MPDIPDPKRSGRKIVCPDCERSWPSMRHLGRYLLHWRIAHGVARPEPR